MESVAELIGLLGAVLMISVVFGTTVTAVGGRKDVSHIMLPDDIMHHLSSAWSIRDVEAADLTAHGYFRLQVRNPVGQEREVLMKRMGDALASCMYDPQWRLPGSASYAWRRGEPSAPAEAEAAMRDAHALLADTIEQRARGLGLTKGPMGPTTLLVDYALQLPSDEAEPATFALDIASAQDRKSLWSGKAVFERHDGNRGAGGLRQSLTDVVGKLFDMLATTKAFEDVPSRQIEL